MATYREQAIAKTTIDLLKKAGIEFTMLGEEEWCCGSVMLRTGNKDVAQEMAEHNIAAFKKAGADTVITSCSGCFKTIKSDYEKLAGSQDYEVKHVLELIKDLIVEGKLTFPEVKMKVTYHDPCHLGRHSEMYDIPREVLKSIQGLELIEMERNRENARCCGAGGGVSSAYKDLSNQMADDRIEDAEKTGAEVLTSACPFCTHQLRLAAERKESKMKVLDITELLMEILGD
jgi:heterodisulfide reductase subunit D